MSPPTWSWLTRGTRTRRSANSFAFDIITSCNIVVWLARGPVCTFGKHGGSRERRAAIQTGPAPPAGCRVSALAGRGALLPPLARAPPPSRAGSPPGGRAAHGRGRTGPDSALTRAGPAGAGQPHRLAHRRTGRTKAPAATAQTRRPPRARPAPDCTRAGHALQSHGAVRRARERGYRRPHREPARHTNRAARHGRAPSGTRGRRTPRHDQP